MQILVEFPPTLPDALQRTPEQFAQEAKMAMAVKLYELKRLSSGMAATLAGIDRVQFLRELHQYGIAVIDTSAEELAADIAHA